ncbi:RNA-directed DNA polymerase, eukaryota [Tanacetum coccineum]
MIGGLSKDSKDRVYPRLLCGSYGDVVKLIVATLRGRKVKVNVLAWKISMDRLPTRVNLHRRGVQVSPISCPICCEALENLDHLLFCCDLAKDIARFNQVQNKCWKECFTLPGGVSGHIETISSSLIQIFEKMVFLKT